jgi:hypothetical protein
VDGELNSVYVKRIGIEDLVGYAYIIRVDYIISIRPQYNYQFSQYSNIHGIKALVLDPAATLIFPVALLREGCTSLGG